MAEDLESGGSTRPPSIPLSTCINPSERIELDSDHIPEWAINHHLRNLIEKLHDPKPDVLHFILETLPRGLSAMFRWQTNVRPPVPPPQSQQRFRISLAELQRMRLRKLQCQLVKDVIQMRCEGTEPPGWEERLKEYVTALQDHDYMTKCSQGLRDPFLVTGEYTVDNYVFRRLASEKDDLLSGDFNMAPSIHPWEDSKESSPICGTRNENEQNAKLKSFEMRLLIATLGGMFLIGPMWLMVLVKSWQYTALVSTTAFVAVFGFIMACFLTDYKDVLASTAAYAAVLVVFVGTNSTPSS